MRELGDEESKTILDSFFNHLNNSHDLQVMLGHNHVLLLCVIADVFCTLLHLMLSL